MGGMLRTCALQSVIVRKQSHASCSLDSLCDLALVHGSQPRFSPRLDHAHFRHKERQDTFVLKNKILALLSHYNTYLVQLLWVDAVDVQDIGSFNLCSLLELRLVFLDI